jgi:hypothetical protein
MINLVLTFLTFAAIKWSCLKVCVALYKADSPAPMA